MNNARSVKARAELESLVSTLKDDLDLFTDTGGLDRAMCNGVRVKMETLKKSWEEVTKDFTNLFAAAMEGEARDNTIEAQNQYRKAYMGAIKNAGAASSLCDIWIRRMSTIHLHYRAMSSAMRQKLRRGD